VTLTVGSTFTGVGGADLGLEWAGFRIAWQCELDPWKRSILAAHWPDTPIHDDITTLHDPEPVDVMIGGFPCQDLSVAGKRKGFDGERSVLAFEFLRVAESLGESSLSPVEPTLSSVLERQADSRYALSSKAAAGILRRAGRRGRTLPPMLESALRAVAESQT